MCVLFLDSYGIAAIVSVPERGNVPGTFYRDHVLTSGGVKKTQKIVILLLGRKTTLRALKQIDIVI